MTEQLFNLIKEFQDKTFPTATALSKLHHLKEEVDELIKAVEENDPNLRLELADCFLLLIGATRKLGFSFYDMDPIILEKLEIIKLRKWGEPDEKGVVKHIKEPETVTPKVYYCTFCKTNVVDADNVFDTCNECLAKQ